MEPKSEIKKSNFGENRISEISFFITWFFPNSPWNRRIFAFTDFVFFDSWFWPIFANYPNQNNHNSLLSLCFIVWKYANLSYCAFLINFGRKWILVPFKSIRFAFSTYPNYLYKNNLCIKFSRAIFRLLECHCIHEWNYILWLCFRSNFCQDVTLLSLHMQLTQFSLIVGKATGKNRVSYSISFSCKMRWFSQWRQILESLCLPSSKKGSFKCPPFPLPLYIFLHTGTPTTLSQNIS